MSQPFQTAQYTAQQKDEWGKNLTSNIALNLIKNISWTWDHFWCFKYTQVERSEEEVKSQAVSHPPPCQLQHSRIVSQLKLLHKQIKVKKDYSEKFSLLILLDFFVSFLPIVLTICLELFFNLWSVAVSYYISLPWCVWPWLVISSFHSFVVWTTAKITGSCFCYKLWKIW